jgi:Na+/proline symporter
MCVLLLLCSNASVMLLPVSVIIYTVVGGLKATFTSSYIHTASAVYPSLRLSS